VAVHDAARPCLTPELIESVFAAAVQHGAALPGLPVGETLKRVGQDHKTVETVSRAGLYTAQTPQVFRRDLIVRAYENRPRQGSAITDDAQLVEALGESCHMVEGSPWNIKITARDDLRLAAAILQAMPKPKREGPSHPFADEQSMWGGPLKPAPKPKPKDLF
jgi:2-C-methyl-D-erythritol 4-phosphate cytidylyltransferase